MEEDKKPPLRTYGTGGAYERAVLQRTKDISVGHATLPRTNKPLAAVATHRSFCPPILAQGLVSENERAATLPTGAPQLRDAVSRCRGSTAVGKAGSAWLQI